MAQVVVDCLKCTFDNSGNRDVNYGGDAGVKCQTGIVKGENYRSYYEVDLSAAGIPADAIVQSTSKFEQYITSHWEGEVGQTYRLVRNTGAWDEDTLTYNNPPGIDSPIVTSIAGPGGADAWYAITGSDIVPFINEALDNQGGIFSVRLESLDTGSGFIAHSDDGANKPKLTVDYLLPHVQVAIIG